MNTQSTPTPPHFESTILHIGSNMTPLSNEPRQQTTAYNDKTKSEYFKIRFAHNNERRQSATILVEKQYKSQGYQAHESTIATTIKPDRITLLVHDKDNEPIGTITIGADSSEGLLADELYHTELDAMRSDSRIKLLELTKFAMERHRGNSRQVLASLFNVAYVYTKQMGCNWMVIEVNPSHVSFYENNLGFKVIGMERTCPRVNASAILLGLDLKHTAEQVRKFGGGINDAEAGKSFYRYFLSETDEAGLTQRLFPST